MTAFKDVVAFVVAAHGVGFFLWFQAAWLPAAQPSQAHWLFNAGVGVGDPIGRATGLLALVVAAGFLAAAWGIFVGSAWWESVALATSAVSLVAIVIPWWTVVPPLSAIGAAAVDLALIGFVVVPSWHDALVT